VDALLAAARQESASGHGTADAFAVAEGVIGNCAGLAAERELAVEVERPTPPIRIGVDADLAERVLQPVVENACRYGRHQVRITVERRNGAVVYSVDDDGPGVADDEGEAIFEPGTAAKPAVRTGAPAPAWDSPLRAGSLVLRPARSRPCRTVQAAVS
jgi:two-component system heavy metal sensor histidine kinase CusS